MVSDPYSALQDQLERCQEERVTAISEIERLRDELEKQKAIAEFEYNNCQKVFALLDKERSRVAKLEAVREAALSPLMMRAIARYMKVHGDIENNAVCLTAIHLEGRAELLQDALRDLEGGDDG